MYGAILGDIIGSRFEFDNGGWSKEFELITDDDQWTDDSVMTIAVAEALMNAGKDADVSEIEEACIRSMQKWGQRYSGAGYGGRFIHWVNAKDPKPYGSYGNGSAMRVSAAGWLYDSLERTREAARATAEVSHNHPEGIKGAECTAAVIYLARNGASKKDIEEYVIREFGYDFTETLDEMRARHKHDETCMDSMPKALRSFFDGVSYEDAVRNAVSLGGDTDTIAAIAGAMGEAFFGIPLVLTGRCGELLEKDMLEVLDRFNRFIGRTEQMPSESQYADNAILEAAYVLFMGEEDMEKRPQAFLDFLNVMVRRMAEEAYVPMPFVDINNTMLKGLDINNVKAGDTFSPQEEVRLKMDTMTDVNGDLWIPLFFNEKALNKGETANVIIPVALYDVLKIGLDRDDVKGVVVDPFGKPFVLSKDLLTKYLSDYMAWAEQNGIQVPGRNSMDYKEPEMTMKEEEN